MMRLWFSLWLAFSILHPGPLLAGQPRITSPQPGDALQGVVTITGSTQVENFKSAEVSFAYDQEDSPNWFPIQRSQEAVREGPLAQWDTTTITDGLYTLRLQVTLQDGSRVETQVDGLRVRNYTPIETQPAARPTLADSGQPTASPTPGRVQPPTPSPLPANPAEVTSGALTFSALQGAALAVLALAALGVYAFITALRRR